MKNYKYIEFVHFWAIKDAISDINGGIVIAAPDKDTAIKVFKNMFESDNVMINKININPLYI